METTVIGSQFRIIKQASNELFEVFMKISPNQTTPVENVPERLVNIIRPSLDKLQSMNSLSYSYSVNGIGFAAPDDNGGENFGTFTINLTDKAHRALRSSTG